MYTFEVCIKIHQNQKGLLPLLKKVKEKFLKLNPFGLLSCILSVRRFTHGRR